MKPWLKAYYKAEEAEDEYRKNIREDCQLKAWAREQTGWNSWEHPPDKARQLKKEYDRLLSWAFSFQQPLRES